MNNIEYYNVQKFRNIRELLEIADREAAYTPAFRYIDGDTTIEVNYSRFVRSTEQLGAFLFDRGLGASHIACIGQNSYKWVLTYLTVLAGAGVFIPVDKDLSDDEIINVLQDSECEAVFYDGQFEELLREHMNQLARVKLFFGFDRNEDEEDMLSFDKALEAGKDLPKDGYIKTRSPENALKMLVYTSGTTGSAKGVMLSEHNLVSSVYYGLMVSRVYDTAMSVLPFNHTYEAVSDILVSLHCHSTICINDSFKSCIRNFGKYKPSYVYLVPSAAEVIYSRIMREIKSSGNEDNFKKMVEKSKQLLKKGVDKRTELFEPYRVALGGRLVKIVCGGAPVRPETAEFFENIGINFINGYGITECSPLVSANREGFNDYHTAGIRLPCLEWRIESPDSDGIGEICVKGDVVMLGYWKQPEKTAEVLRDGWFYTGDYGYINDKDQLIITGRKKNVIVLSNGKNVYPEEIEGYIQGIEGVKEVIVSGEADEKGNDSRLTAEVFLEEQKPVSELLNKIREVCKGLPFYKQISDVKIRDREFEKTSTNKIKRFIKKHRENAAEKENKETPAE